MGVAFGRVGPGTAPAGWTVTITGAVLGAVIGLGSCAALALALRRRGESPTTAGALALAPATVCAGAQVAAAFAGGATAPAAVATLTAAILAGGAVGSQLAVRRAGQDHPVGGAPYPTVDR